jgi:hypothetical protein
MSGDTHLTGMTWDGKEIELYIEQDVSVSYVSIQTQHIGYLRFNFNPDFPEDAKKMFLALCEVRSIIQEAS